MAGKPCLNWERFIASVDQSLAELIPISDFPDVSYTDAGSKCRSGDTHKKES